MAGSPKWASKSIPCHVLSRAPYRYGIYTWPLGLTATWHHAMSERGVGIFLTCWLKTPCTGGGRLRIVHRCRGPRWLLPPQGAVHALQRRPCARVAAVRHGAGRLRLGRGEKGGHMILCRPAPIYPGPTPGRHVLATFIEHTACSCLNAVHNCMTRGLKPCTLPHFRCICCVNVAPSRKDVCSAVHARDALARLLLGRRGGGAGGPGACAGARRTRLR